MTPTASKFPTVYLISRDFPQAGSSEFNFLCQEIEHLTQHFKVVIAPLRLTSKCYQVLPDEITVDLSLAKSIASPTAWFLSVSKMEFWLGIYREAPAVIRKKSFVRHALRLVRAALLLNLSQKWALKLLSSQKGNSLIYTWWFTPETLGVAISAKYFGVPVVTRAHGIDVYEEYYPLNYKAFRKRLIHLLCAIYPASEDASKYLRAKYPQMSQKIVTKHLGVLDPFVETRPD